MAAIQVPFFTATGEAKGTVELPESLFGAPGSRYVLHEAIVNYQRNERRGTSMTKTRGLVSGGGRKPWKQKGTGNARAGSIRSPLWRKGGIIFGPQPRSYRVDMGAGKRLLALQTAITLKAQSSELVVFDSVKLKDSKTQKAAQLLSKAAAGKKALLVVEKSDASLNKALRNLSWLTTTSAGEVNALTLFSAAQVILTKAALDALVNRFPKG